jgi:protein SCO1
MRKMLTALAYVVPICIYSGVAFSTSWLTPGPIVPQSELIDQDGKSWQLEKLVANRPVLLSFFFTSCTTVCPTQTLKMSLVRDELKKRQFSEAKKPLLLSISLDPLSDTPETVKKYIDKFSVAVDEKNNWLMLTGTFESLRPVWRIFEQPDGDAAEHSAIMWVGQPANARWTRVGTDSTVAEITALLEEDAP